MKLKPTFLQILLLNSAICSATDYYWVGGTGNWSEHATHWATTSGGITFHTQVPTPFDNLHFDANSFTSSNQVVTINQTIIQFHDMDWTGVTNMPKLTGTAVNTAINVYGSLTFSSGMINSVSGFNFEATTTGHTITSGGNSLGSARFNGIGGGWTLLDEFNGSIRLNAGTLNFNNQTVSGSFYSQGNFSRSLIMGSSIFSTVSNSDSWYIEGSGFSLDAGTSTIIITGSRQIDVRNNLTYHDILFTNSGRIQGFNNTFNNVSFTGIGSFSSNNTFNNVTFAQTGSIADNCIFNGTVTFNNVGNIGANNTFNILNFTPGFTYTLQSGSTNTINTLNATGNCSNYITVKSSTAGSQATIHQTSGTLSVSYTYLKDINATGGASFISTNTIDLGNNSGWTITGPTPQNLYWVEGTGNWSDGSHWAAGSGGPAIGCSPTQLDNVYFDVNSFTATDQTVNIDVPTASFVNMDWTGVTNMPKLTGTAVNTAINVYGSLTFSSGMINSVSGFNFEATTTGHTITSGGNSLGSARFNGIGGGWTLLDEFNGSIRLNAGTLNFNNQTVSGSFYSQGNFSRSLIMGSSIFSTVSNSDSWYIEGSGFSLDAGTSTIIITGSRQIDVRNNLTYHDILFTNSGRIQGFNNTFNNVSFTGIGSFSSNNTFNNVTFAQTGSIADNCIFNGTVTFNNVGNIGANNTFNILNFTPGFTYTLQSGSTNTINTLNATGNCSNYITVKSSTAGSQATIHQTSGTLSVSYTYLKDINATGGASFISTNTIDLGNNSGWTITGPTPQNLYWVEGTGNWSDGSHWAAGSGGPAIGCSPTQLDNVYFDVNSFTATDQTVNIDVPTASFVNMDWTGVTNMPKLTGTAVNTAINVYGSLTFSSGMINSVSGFNFEATTTGHTITSGGNSLGSARFNGIGGGWTLLDEFNGSIRLNAGTLNFNNQTVSGSFYSQGNFSRSLIMGSSIFSTVSNSDSWYIEGSGFSLDAGTSTIIITGSRQIDVRNNLTYHDILFTNSGRIQGFNNTFNNVSFTGIGSFSSNNTFNNVTFAQTGSIADNCIFNGTVTFNNVGNIGANNTFNILNFTPGFTYTLQSGSTNTINTLNATGNGGFPILITSNSLGNFTTMSKNNGGVCTDFIRIRDIHTTGGAIFNAGFNSIDLGGNSGWNFNVPAIQYFADNDGDSYGVSNNSLLSCSPSGIYTATVAGDCNDSNSTIHPGATEISNGLDDNCDGQIDEGLCDITVTAGEDLHMYFGYVPEQCKTKTVIVNGGMAPFMYNWTLNRPLLSNVITPSGDETIIGVNSSTVTFCLLDTAILHITVTDALGCTLTDSAIIFAEDVRCFAGNSSNQKVKICHNGNTICVDENAINAHLGHGDYIGPCISARIGIGNITQTETYTEIDSKFEFSIYPNPSKADIVISLNMSNPDESKGTIQIINVSGQLLKRIEVNGQQKININLNNKGVYFIQLTTSKQVLTKKITVMN